MMDKLHLRAEANLQASEEEGVVTGVAVDYDRVGYFPGNLKVAIAPGAANGSIAERTSDPLRDILCLKAHEVGSTLARTGNGTLSFQDYPDRLEYSAQLNLDDPEAKSVWEKVKRGDYTAASIGFVVEDAEKTKMADNSPEAANPGEEVNVMCASEISISEVSILAQGAFAGATSHIAGYFGPMGVLDYAETINPQGQKIGYIKVLQGNGVWTDITSSTGTKFAPDDSNAKSTDVVKEKSEEASKTYGEAINDLKRRGIKQWPTTL